MVLLVPWLGYLCYSDVKFRRLPDRLTLGGLAVGLIVQSAWGGWAGAKSALLATVVSALFLLIPYLLRQAGAGDVKMLAACGAFVGLRQVPVFLMLTSFAALAVMVWMLCAHRASPVRLKHYLRVLFDWRYDRKAGRAALPSIQDRRVGVPYGVAIAIGTLLTLVTEVFA